MNRQSLFNDLMVLCADSDTFYYVDRVVGKDTYRIFNYRLSSWTEMQRPNAKNCRGTTFISLGDDWCLVSFTPEKFFNLEEGGVDHTPHVIGCVMEKRDGSLISTVNTFNGSFVLKSKASFDSDQAVAATKWLFHRDNSEFLETVAAWEGLGYTVNMEWTAPDNRIVVPYQESKLTILNVRSYLDILSDDFAETYYGDDLRRLADHYGNEYIPEHYVQFETLDSLNHSIFADMKAETEGEGYVVEIQHPEGSYLIKVKNDKYLALHHTKDSINMPTKLFEAIIMETGDDLRSLFHDDPYSLNLIQAMEDRVVPNFNHMIYMVEKFHEMFKDQDRKTYAIQAQKQYPDFMSLCMNMYLGRENDYKAFAIKNAEKLFGVSNVVKEATE